MSASPLARIAIGSALAGFVLGGARAAWTIAGSAHVLEFQAGAGAPLSQKLSAFVQSAAIEGVGFGLLGLALGALAVAFAGAMRAGGAGGRGERIGARFVLLAAAVHFWIEWTWLAEEALPFLALPGVVLLDLVGFVAALAALWGLRAAAGALPWAPPRSLPASLAALTLATVLGAGVASSLVRSLLIGTGGGWRSPGRLAAAAGILLAALLVAALLARLLRPLVGRVADRLASGPLVPRPASVALGAALALCALAALPLVRTSSVTARPEFARAAERRVDPGPNVVLVTIDTLRADRLGCYGYGRPTSPFLDSLAANGARFADPVAPASWTKPSTGTILTGLYPSRHGALYRGSSLQLPEGKQTLAEAFRARGYLTAGFVSNPNVKAVFDFDRGFDVFFDSPVEDTVTLACIRGTWFGRMLMKLLRHQFNWKYENDVREMNRHVRAWLAKNHDRRFFLYVHYIDPHIPYDPPAAYRADFARDHGFPLFNKRKELVGTDLYDAEIRYVDDGMRDLVGELERLGALSNTLIAITSDHGEEFFEHGVLGHGFSLFQPVVQVPLILNGPGVPAGRVVEQPVQILDLPATLLDLAGAGLEAFGDGTSFARALRDPQWRREHGYFLESEFGQDVANERAFVFTGVREGPLKLVLTEHNQFFPPAAHGRAFLYDLAADPEERRNLIAEPEYHAIAEALQKKLRGHSEFLQESGFRDVEPAALSPEIEASLKALGY